MPTTPTTTMRLDEETLALLDWLAAELGQNRTALIRLWAREKARAYAKSSGRAMPEIGR